jgi:hypothetical protein
LGKKRNRQKMETTIALNDLMDLGATSAMQITKRSGNEVITLICKEENCGSFSH